MPQLVPLVANEPFYRFNTTLDGIQYILDVRWNGRDCAWYFDILSEDEDPLVSGTKLVLGTWMPTFASDPRRPFGLFTLVDWTNTSTEATLENIGVTCGLYFYSIEELEDFG